MCLNATNRGWTTQRGGPSCGSLAPRCTRDSWICCPQSNEKSCFSVRWQVWRVGCVACFRRVTLHSIVVSNGCCLPADEEHCRQKDVSTYALCCNLFHSLSHAWRVAASRGPGRGRGRERGRRRRRGKGKGRRRDGRGIPATFFGRGWGLPDSNELFVGMPGIETPLHFDERENLFFQAATGAQAAVRLTCRRSKSPSYPGAAQPPGLQEDSGANKASKAAKAAKAARAAKAAKAAWQSRQSRQPAWPDSQSPSLPTCQPTSSACSYMPAPLHPQTQAPARGPRPQGTGDIPLRGFSCIRQTVIRDLRPACACAKSAVQEGGMCYGQGLQTGPWHESTSSIPLEPLAWKPLGFSCNCIARVDHLRMYECVFLCERRLEWQSSRRRSCTWIWTCKCKWNPNQDCTHNQSCLPAVATVASTHCAVNSKCLLRDCASSDRLGLVQVLAGAGLFHHPLL